MLVFGVDPEIKEPSAANLLKYKCHTILMMPSEESLDFVSKGH